MALSKTEEKIREMAKLSILSDRISDVQLTNLKYWPYVFFNGVTGARLTYDLSTRAADGGAVLEEAKSNSVVTYHLTIEEKSDNSHMDKRFAALESSVRNMFWKSIKVQVLFNNKMVAESKVDE